MPSFYQPPIKAEIWSSSVLTAKPPSALKEVLVSTDEENILLNTKPTRTCREPKNSGAKKSSHSWLNVRPLFLHTSQIATSFYNHTSLIAQLKVSKTSKRVKGIANYCKPQKRSSTKNPFRMNLLLTTTHHLNNNQRSMWTPTTCLQPIQLPTQPSIKTI